MSRGIDRGLLFRDDLDRQIYVETLSKNLIESAASCLAWALMPNHVHLVVRTGSRPLSAVMQRLGTGYARYFNERHGRVGHLFQGRYKSLLVEEDPHLLVLLRYVHRNPLEAGLVDSLRVLAEFPWAGHSVLMGRRRSTFQAVDTVLQLFSPDRARARRKLLHWMGQIEAPDCASDPVSTIEGILTLGEPIHRDARLVGNQAFTEQMLGQLEGSERAKRRAARTWSLDRVALYVCGKLGANLGHIRAGRRTENETRARAAIAHLAHHALGVPYTRLAPLLGVSHSALSQSAEMGAEVVRAFRLSLS
jgi:REP element-mobilizing transposase RayT